MRAGIFTLMLGSEGRQEALSGRIPHPGGWLVSVLIRIPVSAGIPVSVGWCSTRPVRAAFVVTASSTTEGRDQFKQQPPDVILSDLVVGHEDGLQFIRDIRKLDNAAGRMTPAAALTALARTDDRRRALDAGYQMHVSKPVDPDELAVTVERLAHPSHPQPGVEH